MILLHCKDNAEKTFLAKDGTGGREPAPSAARGRGERGRSDRREHAGERRCERLRRDRETRGPYARRRRARRKACPSAIMRSRSCSTTVTTLGLYSWDYLRKLGPRREPDF